MLRAAAILLLLAPQGAWAHGLEAANGFVAGLAHPVGGMDHLIAMVAVGIVSAKAGGRFIWVIPLTFLCGIAFGYLAGLQQRPLAWSEWGILLSVMVLGVQIAQPWRVPVYGALLVVLMFGVCHGYAHGVEWPRHASPWAFSFGFLGTSTGLHVMGAIVGLIYLQHVQATRHFALTGIFIAAVGSGMAVVKVVLAA